MTSDDVPDAPNEWRAQSTVIYTALIGTGIVMVQPYLTSTDLGTRLSSASSRSRSPILCSRRSCCSATTRTAAIVFSPSTVPLCGLPPCGLPQPQHPAAAVLGGLHRLWPAIRRRGEQALVSSGTGPPSQAREADHEACTSSASASSGSPTPPSRYHSLGLTFLLHEPRTPPQQDQEQAPTGQRSADHPTATPDHWHLRPTPAQLSPRSRGCRPPRRRRRRPRWLVSTRPAAPGPPRGRSRPPGST
jgi:hypothetical protein